MRLAVRECTGAQCDANICARIEEAVLTALNKRVYAINDHVVVKKRPVQLSRKRFSNGVFACGRWAVDKQKLR